MTNSLSHRVCVDTGDTFMSLAGETLSNSGNRSSSAGFRAGQGEVRQVPEDLSILEVLLGGGAQIGAPHQQQSIHNWHLPTALFVIAAISRILKSFILLTLNYPVISSPRVRAVHEPLKLIPEFILCVSWANTTPLLVQLLNTDSVKKCNSILKFKKTLKFPTGLAKHERISWKI